ncbi:putative transmembrane protein [Gregarina niphandrodes]|uniref:Transmembrane protein n=1 Tax=Gregarina niphandrodes TaxID=110365 RepID=A0A023B127_GRENI|nr:putative transmembrane protein [Gregarina niphandrodes]EZG46510.1 putative transmembrane protein [Gregarina niphandrodes]|eukprot:XP_011132283.1 putative transmembrane protein [Gregarina niphandrodes]
MLTKIRTLLHGKTDEPKSAVIPLWNQLYWFSLVWYAVIGILLMAHASPIFGVLYTQAKRATGSIPTSVSKLTITRSKPSDNVPSKVYLTFVDHNRARIEDVAENLKWNTQDIQLKMEVVDTKNRILSEFCEYSASDKLGKQDLGITHDLYSRTQRWHQLAAEAIIPDRILEPTDTIAGNKEIVWLQALECTTELPYAAKLSEDIILITSKTVDLVYLQNALRYVSNVPNSRSNTTTEQLFSDEHLQFITDQREQATEHWDADMLNVANYLSIKDEGSRFNQVRFPSHHNLSTSAAHRATLGKPFRPISFIRACIIRSLMRRTPLAAYFSSDSDKEMVSKVRFAVRYPL